MSARQVQRSTVLGEVYKTLKTGIMTLQLPPGTTMSTQEMADRLNVSRTPVREAFLRLQEEGLLDVVPQRNTTVSRISLKRFDEERFIRESLEVAVVEYFMRLCKPEHFAHLHEMIQQQQICCDEKRYVDFVDLDDEIHKYIFDVADQRLAWQTIKNVTSHYRRIRVLTVQMKDTMARTVEQHELLVKLMEEGKVEAVKKELLSHVRKIHWEKAALLEQYPDYFDCGQDTDNMFGIASL